MSGRNLNNYSEDRYLFFDEMLNLLIINEKNIYVQRI